jgi:hypothetical protein
MTSGALAMIVSMVKRFVALMLCSLAGPLAAQVPLKIYAQELVDQVVAKNPDLLVVAMHVTPPKATQNIIIASNIGRIGKPGDKDDLRVIETGEPNLEVAHGGERYEVELVLRDVAGATVGALGLVWPYKAGQDPAPFGAKARRIRDGLARRILNTANLMDPYPFDPLATTKTYAQKLVEQAVAKHPELSVLAVRGPSGAARELVVLGSTFGRHGKKADADDLKILDSPEPATGVYSGGRRFGVDLQLRDRGGRTVGTMNVGYAYREGDDAKALVARAVALRDELQTRIASGDQLEELDP